VSAQGGRGAEGRRAVCTGGIEGSGSVPPSEGAGHVHRGADRGKPARTPLTDAVPLLQFNMGRVIRGKQPFSQPCCHRPSHCVTHGGAEPRTAQGLFAPVACVCPMLDPATLCHTLSRHPLSPPATDDRPNPHSHGRSPSLISQVSAKVVVAFSNRTTATGRVLPSSVSSTSVSATASSRAS
jgi:hypothetical protein